MRLLMLMVVAVLAAGPAAARNEKPIEAYAGALFDYMAVTWLCREHLGAAAYQSATDIAVNGLAAYVPRPEAQRNVDEMDRRYRTDPRRFEATAAKCRERQSVVRRQIDIEKAKLLE